MEPVGGSPARAWWRTPAACVVGLITVAVAQFTSAILVAALGMVPVVRYLFPPVLWLTISCFWACAIARWSCDRVVGTYAPAAVFMTVLVGVVFLAGMKSAVESWSLLDVLQVAATLAGAAMWLRPERDHLGL